MTVKGYVFSCRQQELCDYYGNSQNSSQLLSWPFIQFPMPSIASSSQKHEGHANDVVGLPFVPLLQKTSLNNSLLPNYNHCSNQEVCWEAMPEQQWRQEGIPHITLLSHSIWPSQILQPTHPSKPKDGSQAPWADHRAYLYVFPSPKYHLLLENRRAKRFVIIWEDIRHGQVLLLLGSRKVQAAAAMPKPWRSW